MPPKQRKELEKMEPGRWYKDHELGNGKTLRALCDQGLLEYRSTSRFEIMGIYTLWKYYKEFKKLTKEK